MPEPDLDDVGRKIREAKDLAREVRQPGIEPGTAGSSEAESTDEEGGASS